MKIGELAEKTGVAPSAIRFYEEEGLLQAPVRGANGYRHYDDNALKRLKIVVAVQKLGFSLETIRGLFMHDGRCSKFRTMEQIDVRLDEVRRLELELAAQRGELIAMRDMLEESVRTGRDPSCPGTLQENAAVQDAGRSAKAGVTKRDADRLHAG
ncbi:MerR family transcriptional regulator [Herbaspirillum lusitanum]|uniref:MerR family transcriptional regulator n=1 Tax=Herbaspirillum lusitanum TaxID=213312 RepID=A0ABW9A5S8_9BURK